MDYPKIIVFASRGPIPQFSGQSRLTPAEQRKFDGMKRGLNEIDSDIGLIDMIVAEDDANERFQRTRLCESPEFIGWSPFNHKRVHFNAEFFREYEAVLQTGVSKRVRIVGHRHHQYGYSPLTHVTIAFEPDNPHDPDAVAVFSTGMKVGYLERGSKQTVVSATRLITDGNPDYLWVCTV